MTCPVAWPPLDKDSTFSVPSVLSLRVCFCSSKTFPVCVCVCVSMQMAGRKRYLLTRGRREGVASAARSGAYTPCIVGSKFRRPLPVPYRLVPSLSFQSSPIPYPLLPGRSSVRIDSCSSVIVIAFTHLTWLPSIDDLMHCARSWTGQSVRSRRWVYRERWPSRSASSWAPAAPTTRPPRWTSCAPCVPHSATRAPPAPSPPLPPPLLQPPLALAAAASAADDASNSRHSRMLQLKCLTFNLLAQLWIRLSIE